MKRFLAGLIGLTVLLAAFGAAGQEIVAPDTLPVGHATLIDCDGEKGFVLWTCWSEQDGYTFRVLPLFMGFDDEGKPIIDKVVWFSAPKAGLYVVTLLDITSATSGVAKSKGIHVGEGTGPNPPNPPTPGGKQQVVVVLESADLDSLPRGQREIVSGLAFRKELTAAGHVFKGVVDVSETLPSNSKLLPFVQACSGLGLPCLAIAPIDGGDVTPMELPLTPADVFKILGMQ